MSTQDVSESPREYLDGLRGGMPARERKLREQGKKTLAKLLHAAVEVFGQRGYHATRVDDIVDVADTSHGTFYLYFSNKEDLLRTLLESCVEDMSQLAEDFDPAVGDEGYPELRAWLGAFADLYEDYWPVMRAWTEAELEGTEFGRVGRKVLGQFASAFVDRIAQSDGDADVDPEIAALAFVAMIERFHYYVETRQIEFEREAILDTLSRIAHDGIFARGS